MSAPPTSGTAPADASPTAIARRAGMRVLARQDAAVALSDAGAPNRTIGLELGEDTRTAARMAEVGNRRNDVLAGARPHPAPETLDLRPDDVDLLRSVLEATFERWFRNDVASPDTRHVGLRIRRSRRWAVACARRRLAPLRGTENDLLSCSGNSYISLTTAGWGVAMALWPEFFETIAIPGADHVPSWQRRRRQ